MSRRGALCAQRRYAQNPIIGYHQESELQLFPSTKQPMVLYKGGHKYKVAYILQREPVTTREKHPFEREWEEMVKEEHKKYPRTPDGGNLPEMMRKKFPDAYKSLSKEGAYWKEPKFVQLELNVVRSFKVFFFFFFFLKKKNHHFFFFLFPNSTKIRLANESPPKT